MIHAKVHLPTGQIRQGTVSTLSGLLGFLAEHMGLTAPRMALLLKRERLLQALHKPVDVAGFQLSARLTLPAPGYRVVAETYNFRGWRTDYSEQRLSAEEARARLEGMLRTGWKVEFSSGTIEARKHGHPAYVQKFIAEESMP